MNVQVMWLNILMAVVPLGAKEWKPSEEFLKAVCTVESSGGRFVVGDNGESLGDFQISEAAWLDVNQWRKARGLKIYSYRNVFNKQVNRAYAADYLSMLYGELNRKLKRAPTHGELYAAYNMGLGSFANVNYKLSRVNRVTKSKCRQIDLMLASNY